jgi:hypothetical protein
LTGDQAAGLLLVAGPVTFLAGAALGVPRVFTEPDPDARLRLLSALPGRWRAAQPLYGLGALLSAAGAGALAAGAAFLFQAVACLALTAGALAWSCRSWSTCSCSSSA